MVRHLALIGFVLIGFAAASDAAEGPFRVVQNDTFVVVFSGGTPVLQYRHDGSPFKPYIKELFTPSGVQVLRDAPADHLHHHGIMYAVAADGVTYWEEREGSGRQIPRSLSEPEISVAPDCSRVGFTQMLDWTAPEEDSPTLREDRTIEVIQAEGVKPTLVTWSTRLTTGDEKAAVEITGHHYYGLGCRLIQSIDQVGRFVYASGEPGPVVRGEERVTPSAWCAYVAPTQDARMTIALFDHPNNLRHPATMFTMPEHFAYLAATLNVWKEPLTISAGQPLSLVYGIAVWDGEATAEEIDATYQKWAVLSANR